MREEITAFGLLLPVFTARVCKFAYGFTFHLSLVRDLSKQEIASLNYTKITLD